MNSVRIKGKIVELSALRYTPAGVPAVEFRLEHESAQAEAGGQREVKAEIEAVALDTQARLVAGMKVGAGVKLEGFLSAKTKRSKKLVLHVTNIEFVEGV